MDVLGIIRPTSPEEVQASLQWCHAHRQPVVTHGGLTGLVGGAVGAADAIALSTERLNKIEEIDTQQRTITVQAGVTLQHIHEALEDTGLWLPLDLGSRGTATIGGNAATNAGGNRVLRYGMTRDMILGLEAVLADGTMVSSLNRLIKNNTGYDVKQLFIGSEGTLGVITRLVLRLFEAPKARHMAFVAVPNFNSIGTLLRHLDQHLDNSLSAFEVLWSNYYDLVTAQRPKKPLPEGYPYYVLLESQGDGSDYHRNRFINALEDAVSKDFIADATISNSERDCEDFWAIRDDVERVFTDGDAFIFDVSLPIGHMETYVEAISANLNKTIGEHRLWIFGHVGDGNLHPTVQPSPERSQSPDIFSQISEALYAPLKSIGGSISAEHGIGKTKKPWLAISRSPEEIALMRSLKVSLDPHNLLNPGLIF
jgi:FAD/FMN-containing dehydrogenase